jgi:hypothetical protein
LPFPTNSFHGPSHHPLPELQRGVCLLEWSA